MLTEENDQWRAASPYMQVEVFAQTGHEEMNPILCIEAGRPCPQTTRQISPT
ncbi:hypothetical protein [Ruegeria intermedia]|uniref:hypothetical protein n=1 Tax=Ruegeria intermedia TaxID=996115 RepID=UPI00165F76A3|nr:hypothetical protein [Ruegeria intermedia]